MEVISLSALTQLAERAEDIANDINSLNGVAAEGVQLPDVSLPITLAALQEWLVDVDEARRKPRLARSKRLLEAEGIDTASIPAAVLEQSESIRELLERTT